MSRMPILPHPIEDEGGGTSHARSGQWGSTATAKTRSGHPPVRVGARAERRFRIPARPMRRATTAVACAAVLGLCAAATAPAVATPPTTAARAATAGTPATSTTVTPATTDTSTIAPPGTLTPTTFTPGTAATTDPNGRYTAREIHTFLKIFYGAHGPGRFARTYGVSDELKERAAQHPGFDVLLCDRRRPRSIAIGPVTTAQSAGVGWATVTTHGPGRTSQGRGAPGEGSAMTTAFTAYVALDASRPMRLLDVACGVTD